MSLPEITIAGRRIGPAYPPLVVFGKGAALHDLVDRDLRVSGHHLFRSAAHLIIDDVRLMLDDFDPGPFRGVDHFERGLQAAFVVDADLGNDEGGVCGTNSPGPD